ncbi:hypothetical protein PENSPDRAFT_748986 [Peniophora sp. CONT]|nr:hypothetical protein PENSPDRAFT_748986 [Peniophora sp. CONT]
MAALLRPQDYPVGPKPDWELDAKLGRLKSVQDSCVLSTSLHESRTTLLSRLLPKFATRGRGGKPAADSPIPPPHTTRLLSKCTLEVGPHTMPDLVVYEVTYLPSAPEAQPTKSAAVAPPQLQPYGGIAPSSSSASSATPFSNVTPELVSRVNAAAQQDAHLAHCIREATAGKASPEEVKYITTTINTLTATDATLWRPAPTALETTTDPSKPRDIIFEYKERPNDRWLLPRGPAFIERDPPNGARLDTIPISLLLSAPATEPAPGEPSSSTSGQQDVVTLRLLHPAQMLHDALVDWVGGPERNMTNRDMLRTTLRKARARQYLQYQLPIGSERLQQFKAAAEPPFLMKSIKPDPNAPGKRKRALATPKKSESSAPVRKQSEGTPSSATPKPPPKKRRTKSTPTTPAMTTKPKQNLAYVLVPPLPASMTGYTKPVIACHHCGKTGVPLHMGGRFCRPCIEAGHATPLPGVRHAPVPALPAVSPATAYTATANAASTSAVGAGSKFIPYSPGPSTSRTS